jgi:type IV secretion system protein VirB8
MNGTGQPSSATRQGVSYFAKADAWWSETLAESQNAQRLAWVFAGIAVLTALLLWIALSALQPLRIPVPVLVDVERDGGGAQPMQRLATGPLSASPVLVAAELARYVTTRESLDPKTFPLDYRAIGIASVGAAKASFESDWNNGPPGGRIGNETNTTRIRTTILGVTLMGPDTARIVFQTERRDGEAPWGSAQSRTVRVKFQLSDRALTPRDRLTNPLGLTVSEYQ